MIIPVYVKITTEFDQILICNSNLQALTEKGERQDALQCYKNALEIDPHNKLIYVESQKLQQLLTKDAKMERNLYRKMFKPTKEADVSSTNNVWVTSK